MVVAVAVRVAVLEAVRVRDRVRVVETVRVKVRVGTTVQVRDALLAAGAKSARRPGAMTPHCVPKP